MAGHYRNQHESIRLHMLISYGFKSRQENIPRNIHEGTQLLENSGIFCSHIAIHPLRRLPVVTITHAQSIYQLCGIFSSNSYLLYLFPLFSFFLLLHKIQIQRKHIMDLVVVVLSAEKAYASVKI